MEIENSSFSDAIHDGIVVVAFYAKYQKEHKKVDTILQELTNEFSNKVYVYKLNVDENPEIAKEFGINKIPSFGIFLDKKPKLKIEGIHPKSLFIDEINKLVR
ncbi:thiol reductase thioredoxin [Candidatus Dojkabacteria bacterium]|nr:thiol reductase thioredoxin [Candidatus Dojkabacteria bacterium]